MGQRQSKGKCNFCNSIISKRSITKHLQSCGKRKTDIETSSGNSKSKKAMFFHLLIEGRDLPMYWMHLEMPGSGTLTKLDRFLRDAWLECCGHLSAFHILGETYTSSPDREYGDRGMDVAIEKILTPGMRFFYEYDFGSTTELAMNVLSVREGLYAGSAIKILAQNDAPEYACIVCGKPATDICAECSYDDGGWLCEECAPEHECGEDMLLPVVNSPRTGVCGYVG